MECDNKINSTNCQRLSRGTSLFDDPRDFGAAHHHGLRGDKSDLP